MRQTGVSAGWGSGLLGVVIFAGSLPATRLAVAGFSPVFLTSARAVIAAAISGAMLMLLREQRPARDDILPLGIVALGAVIGFPLLTALALKHIDAGHSIVFIGLLPLATAIFAVLRGGERPKRLFWLFSVLGSLSVIAFALAQDGGGAKAGDGLMVAAILLCGLGYAEGARLSRRLGGWQVISWALLLALPLMLVLATATRPLHWGGIGSGAWAGLAYVSVFSMWLGFVFWYHGLALGGAARVGQLQLLQPFIGLLLAALVLGEPVAWTMLAAAGAVVLCVGAARRFA